VEKRDSWFVNYQEVPVVRVSGSRLLGNRIALYRRPDFDGATVLDVGCNIGQMCWQALEWGAESVFGVEYDKAAYEKFIEIHNKIGGNITYALDDAENPFFWNTIERFDVCLFLSVIDTKELEDRYALLSKACMKTKRVMYFEGHGADVNPLNKYVLDLWRHTDFTDINYLGHADGRPLIRASREKMNAQGFLKGIEGSPHKKIVVIGKSMMGKTTLAKMVPESEKRVVIDDLRVGGLLISETIEASIEKIKKMDSFILFDYRGLEYVPGADAVYFATRPQCLSTIQRDGGFDKLLRGPGGTPTNVKEIHTIVMDV